MEQSAAYESTFNAWIEDHWGIVVKVIRSFATTESDAQDLEQEVLVQLWNSVKSYAGEAKASTWVYRVSLNTALAWHRNRVRRERHIAGDADLDVIVVPSRTPADRAGEQELLERLYEAIRGLVDFDRALVLLMLDGLSYREIAEVLGITENHVGVALSRARKQLTTLMKGAVDELE